MSKSSTEPFIVQNANDFANAARRLMNRTTVIYISEKDIYEFKERMNLFVNISAIPGILKIHFAKYDPSTALFSVQRHALD